MGQVLETQLIDHCFRPFGDDAATFLDSLSDSEVETLRRALGMFLMEHSNDGSASAVATSALEIPASRDFKSILYKDGGNEGARKIVAFSFRDAAFDTVLPIVGLAISVFSGSLGLGAITTVLGGLKTLWSKVVVLKAPADADAIAVLTAIVRVRARFVAIRETRYPTNADIERELSAHSITLKPALARLKSLKVIEAVNWGAQAENLEHAANSWKVRL